MPWPWPERAAAWYAGLAWCMGCNAVLGIDQPSSAPEETTSEPVFEGGSRDPGDGTLDGGTAETPPPSAYARAAWPMPTAPATSLPNTQAYEVSVEGVVTDLVTQLEWQQSVDDIPRTWDEANRYCAALTLAGGGFRLPARIELISLLDLTRAGVSIDPTFFPEAPGDRFWSASPVAGVREEAWLIDFHFSTRAALHAHTAEAHRVRCVASPGRADAPRGHFKLAPESVEDTATELIWQRSVPEMKLGQSDAEDYCAGLTLDDATWRLPTLKELHTLVDETQTAPTIDREAFPNTPSAQFWTSSHLATFPIYAWAVDFATGADLWFATDKLRHVRCVR